MDQQNTGKRFYIAAVVISAGVYEENKLVSELMEAIKTTQTTARLHVLGAMKNTQVKRDWDLLWSR